MSLLTQQTPAQTEEQIAALKRQQAIGTAIQLSTAPRNMFLVWKSGVELIWRNPNGLTPEQVVTALGNNAVELFSMSADFAAMLEKHSPGITKETVAIIGVFTPNADGSITI